MTDVARVALEADSSGLRRAQGDLKKFSGQAKTTGDRVSNLGRTIKTLGSALAIGAAFRQIIRNTAEQERVTAQLEQTLRSTGRYTEELSSGLQDYASALQSVTTFGDEAIIGAQSLLLTFTQIGEEAFPRAQEAVLDVATAMGTDLKSAAVQVGKALNDPVLGLTALQRSGIQFNDTQKETIKGMVEMGDAAGAQAIILDELETQFGGSARAARNTLGGAIQSLKNAFGDLLEGDGGGAGITGATRGINDLSDTLSDPKVVAGFNSITEAVLGIVGSVARATAEITGFAEWAGEQLAAITQGAASDDIVRLRDELDTLYSMLDNPTNRIRFFGKDGLVEIYGEDEIWDMIAEAENKIVEAQDQMGARFRARDPVTVGDININVPRVGTSGDDPGPLGDDEDLKDKFEARREALLQGLESERHTILREFGERDALISELESRSLEEGGITQMQAANARIQNEQMKQDQLTELTRHGEDERLRIQERNAQLAAQVHRQSLGAIGDIFGNMAKIAEKGGEEQFSTWKAMASAQAAVSTALAITNALAVPPAPVGIALASTIGALGAVQIAQIQATEYQPSFDGGGFTGSGSRSGGVDGKGGFPAILHPNETVIDHTRNQSTNNSNSTNVTQVFQMSDNVSREVKQQIAQAAPFIRSQARQAVLEAISQGGSMSKAVGRR